MQRKMQQESEVQGMICDVRIIAKIMNSSFVFQLMISNNIVYDTTTTTNYRNRKENNNDHLALLV